MIKFLIASLPRSRSTWLANFLTTDKTTCLHDHLADCESLTEFRMSGKGLCGAAETAIGLFPSFVNSLKIPKVIIHRDLDEVIDSCIIAAQNIHHEIDGDLLIKGLKIMQSGLINIDGFHVKYQDINAKLPQIWDICTGLPYDEERGKLLMGFNVTTAQVVIDNIDHARMTRLLEGSLCH